MSAVPDERVDRALLSLTQARERADEAARLLESYGAERHLVEALDTAGRGLGAIHERLLVSVKVGTVPLQD